MAGKTKEMKLSEEAKKDLMDIFLMAFWSVVSMAVCFFCYFRCDAEKGDFPGYEMLFLIFLTATITLKVFITVDISSFIKKHIIK